MTMIDPEVIAALSVRHVPELRRSWEVVMPVADEVAALFYSRLFELDPSLRALFHSHPTVQRQKLMDALTLVVTQADRPNELLPVLSALGERHVAYGVRAEHYNTVGEALIWTLDQGLGLLRTAEARDAWIALWEFVATTMGGSSRAMHTPH